MKSEVLKRKDQEKDFPGGTMDENPTATAGATGSISALGRFHILQSNEACGPQLLIPCTATTKACAPRAWLCNKRSHCNGELMHHTKEQPLLTAARESQVQQ